MRKIVTSRSSHVGAPPGTVSLKSGEKSRPARINIIQYDKDKYSSTEIKDAAQCRRYREASGVTWINIDGISDIPTITEVCRIFEIHPLVLEDIININQRPKMDEYEGYIYLTTKMLYEEEKTRNILIEQLSFILMGDTVISFQEREGDIFSPIRERIEQDIGFIRKRGGDYLLYALLDAVVDNYFVIIENIEDNMQALENSVLKEPRNSDLRRLQHLKNDLVFLRRYMWPTRDIVGRMAHGDVSLIKGETHVFMRDVYDHTMQVIETIETFQEIATGMLDIYLSSLNNRMNAIMKFLTIIATIFIPLTFITGIYGMNFHYMPELGWRWGYPVALSLMLIIAVVMIVYFKKKKWF